MSGDIQDQIARTEKAIANASDNDCVIMSGLRLIWATDLSSGDQRFVDLASGGRAFILIYPLKLARRVCEWIPGGTPVSYKTFLQHYLNKLKQCRETNTSN